MQNIIAYTMQSDEIMQMYSIIMKLCKYQNIIAEIKSFSFSYFLGLQDSSL
jgi:hypothetical protein